MRKPKRTLKKIGKHFICSSCHKKKLLRFVAKVGDFSLSFCGRCRYEDKIARLNKNLEAYMKYRMSTIRARAKKQRVLCTITYQDLLQLFKEQKGQCFYTDEELLPAIGNGKQVLGLSIDKIVNSRGYTYHNVVLCTNRANAVKNDLTLIEIKTWLPGWYKRIQRKWNAS